MTFRFQRRAIGSVVMLRAEGDAVLRIFGSCFQLERLTQAQRRPSPRSVLSRKLTRMPDAGHRSVTACCRHRCVAEEGRRDRPSQPRCPDGPRSSCGVPSSLAARASPGLCTRKPTDWSQP